ncbi:MAG: sigma-54 dependent transcriptional regulator [Candidatus Hydrogenedentes bacterium]|nr:sigma-54 dependent transcriptional regulator [Candidatus Hydrogenedentota bacterium]
MATPSILVVEDDEEVRQCLCDTLNREGYRVFSDGNAEDGIRDVTSSRYDLILVDLQLPRNRSGLEIIRAAREHDPKATLCVLTGHASVETAVQAMQLGALDYIQKRSSYEEIVAKVGTWLEHSALQRHAASLEQEIERHGDRHEMIGESPVMVELGKLIARAATSDCSVLIGGEMGTGKELVARAIHDQSPRHQGPFVATDCGFPPTLAESELFGVIRQYPGLHNHEALIGRFEQADGGTLFLDEVGELPKDLQGKLLRALEEKEIRPLGARGIRHVDVRVVAATNCDLERAIGDGGFRQDLYCRLNVVAIDVPPLRDRKIDIPALVRYFLNRTKSAQRHLVEEVSPEAMKALEEYDYPGNVRELRNIIELAVIRTEGRVVEERALRVALRDGASAATPAVRGGANTLRKAMEQAERDYLVGVLDKAGGMQIRAAQMAGIDRKTLSDKLRKYRIRPSGRRHKNTTS